MSPPPEDPLQQLDAPLPHLPLLSAAFDTTFHALALTSHTQFLPTPVRALPTGAERGQFLALDLGGTNLRVAHIELQHPPRIHDQGSWGVPEALKSSTAESLFHWVSLRILDVLRRTQQQQGEAVVELGITFSFPMQQTAHTAALLMPMGKGFTFTHTNDLAALLTAAYAAARTPADPETLRIVSITNDSVATLLTTAYTHPATPTTAVAAGIIAGTGTNATCMCPLRKLHPRKHPPAAAAQDSSSSILLNTEWSISGTAPPLLPYTTRWDRALDARNEKPGFQPLEEMVAGRYLGELVRLVCLDVFPPAPAQQRMNAEYGVDTKLCADVEAADSDLGALEVLNAYFGGGWDAAAAAVFRRVCERVSTRAAALVAAATVGVLGMNGELENAAAGGVVVVGYTGTVLERYPRFRERCEGFMQRIVGERSAGVTVRLVEARDGGVVGAAVLAAMVKCGRT